MEDQSDDCRKPSDLVCVHMQGQEVLFSENMPLGEVIVHLTRQLSVGSPTKANVGTPSWTLQGASLQEEKKMVAAFL